MTSLSQVVLVGCSARSAAQSMVSSGWTVIAIDQFADRDLTAIAEAVSVQRFPDDVEAKLEPYRGLPIIPVGGMENHFEIVERLAEKHFWCGVTAETLRRVRDPAEVGKLAVECGLCSPRRRSAIDLWQPDSEGSDPIRWLWKPFDSGGGHGIHMAPAGKLAHPSGYLQQWIDGKSLGVTLLVTQYGEVELSGCCWSYFGFDHSSESPFIYRGSHGPVPLEESDAKALREFARRLAVESRYRGLMQVDLIMDHDSRLWVLEVNPRWSASMEVLERSGVSDLLARHLAAYGVTLPPRPKKRQSELPVKYAWKDIVYAEQELKFDDRHDSLLKVIAHRSSEGSMTQVVDLPKIGTKFSNGEPIFTIVVTGLNRDPVEEQVNCCREIWRNGIRHGKPENGPV